MNAQEIILGHQRGDTLCYKHLDENLIKFQLEDLRQTNALAIRIYYPNHIYEITKDSIFYLPYVTVKEDRSKPFLGKRFAIKNTFDFFPVKDFIAFRDIPQMSFGIDAVNYDIEIQTYKEYYYYSSLGNCSMEPCIDTLVTTLKTFIQQRELFNDYLSSLPENHYYGIREGNLEILPVPLNKLLESIEPKSKLYLKVEKIIKEEFKVDENSDRYLIQRILLEPNRIGKLYEFEGILLKDLNQIHKNKVKKFQVHNSPGYDRRIIIHLKK